MIQAAIASGALLSIMTKDEVELVLGKPSGIEPVQPLSIELKGDIEADVRNK